MKIDERVSYCAAACWAGVIDNEVHVSSLSLQANGGRSKGSAKDCDVARMHGRLAMASQLNRPEYCSFAVRICRDALSQISLVIHSLKLRRTTEFSFTLSVDGLTLGWGDLQIKTARRRSGLGGEFPCFGRMIALAVLVRRAGLQCQYWLSVE